MERGGAGVYCFQVFYVENKFLVDMKLERRTRTVLEKTDKLQFAKKNKQTDDIMIALSL